MLALNNASFRFPVTYILFVPLIPSNSQCNVLSWKKAIFIQDLYSPYSSDFLGFLIWFLPPFPFLVEATNFNSTHLTCMFSYCPFIISFDRLIFSLFPFPEDVGMLRDGTIPQPLTITVYVDDCWIQKFPLSKLTSLLWLLHAFKPLLILQSFFFP